MLAQMTNRGHSLSLAVPFVVTCCTTRYHSLHHSLSFIVTRRHSLHHSLSFVVTRFHPSDTSIDVSLVCLFKNDRYKRGKTYSKNKISLEDLTIIIIHDSFICRALVLALWRQHKIMSSLKTLVSKRRQHGGWKKLRITINFHKK